MEVLLFIVGIAILITAIGVLIYLKNKRNSFVYRKLLKYKRERPDYLFYISIKGNREWIKVDDLIGKEIISQNKKIAINDINSLIISYKNGEILDHSNVFFPLPQDVHFIEESVEKPIVNFKLGQLESGKDRVFITNDAFRYNGRKKYYRTTIKNVSSYMIRVQKFCSYVKIDDTYKMNTVTNTFFTQEEFIEWFAVNKDGWIKPGQAVSDPNNYGSGKDSVWVYYFVDENGNEFIAGIPLPE